MSEQAGSNQLLSPLKLRTPEVSPSYSLWRESVVSGHLKQLFLAKNKHTPVAHRVEGTDLDRLLYVHQPLRLDVASIRFVVVLPPACDGMIQCTMRIKTLDDLDIDLRSSERYETLRYTCLSYVWGSGRGNILDRHRWKILSSKEESLEFPGQRVSFEDDLPVNLN